MKKLKDFGLLDRILLKIMHKIQKFALNKCWMDTYMLLFNMHFSKYFNKDLRTEVLALSEEGKAAMRRHARLVLKVTYDNQTPRSKKYIYKACQEAFRNNMILQEEL